MIAEQRPATRRRSAIPDEVAARVLFASDRTCCVCRTGELWWQVRALQELGWESELADLLLRNSDVIESAGDPMLLMLLAEVRGDERQAVELRIRIFGSMRLMRATHTSADELPAELQSYLGEVVDTVEAFGAPVSGAFVLGSVLLGGFDPERSDLDVVIVVARPLSSFERAAVVRAVDGLPVPGRKLELVLYVAGAKPPAYELNYPNGDGEPDFWFVLDAAIAQDSARPFTGRPWGELLPPVSEDETRRAAEELLAWAEARAEPVHAARARHYLEHGNWITKEEARA